jgi:hypothetical protein
MSVLELRQYTLHPGQRDVLIELFDREFVESQEVLGMRVLGQFRDLGNPDRFVWLRGFPDMASRPGPLNSFYTGPVWKAHARAANATMIDSDNVLLLRPTGPGTDFSLSTGRSEVDVESLVVATIYYFDTPVDDAFIQRFNQEAAPLLEKAGAPPLGRFVTEYAENNFPALPVRTGEHVFVWFASFPGENAYAEHGRRLAELPEWAERVEPHLASGTERLLLTPTARSLLR